MFIYLQSILRTSTCFLHRVLLISVHFFLMFYSPVQQNHSNVDMSGRVRLYDEFAL